MRRASGGSPSQRSTAELAAISTQMNGRNTA